MSYTPAPPPNDPAMLSQYVFQEFQRIAEALRNGEFEQINLKQINVAPPKPRNGDVARADGTNWNPGSGEGVYARLGGAWSKL